MDNVSANYIRLLDEEMGFQTPGRFRSPGAFSSFLVTGLPTEETKDWLMNTVMERGQKKWEKVTLSSYENMRRIASEHLQPAFERLIVLLSRLRGLARGKSKTPPWDLTPQIYSAD